MRSVPLTVMAMASSLFMLSCASTEEPKAPPAPTAIAPPVTNMEAPPVADPASAAPATAVAQLNPPHGEPGHRCEIPVGAPLDGSAAPSTQAPTAISVTPTAANAGAPPSGPAAGASGKINPPHGEPGHDCAVPVGSPLP